MKKILLLITIFNIQYSIFNVQFAQNYNPETFSSDPIQAKIYTLANGLKVYISVNKNEPRIQTNIAVRAGSKNDPSDNTGLAHYLEHMVFKGTSHIATTNWNEEKKLLQQISDLYEKHKATNDTAQKGMYYRQIDSISQIAVKYAAPNEYDKMISSLGAQGTNAFTSNEMTVYINDIPSNAFEKWLLVESERFSELTLRLFHTELEAVYEEFNRAQDNDFRKVQKVLYAELFKKHPYGTQTTIGLGEHLKNPSLVKIHEFFNTYYVPNNMAISIAGDINPDSAVAMIDKYFGKLKPKEVPPFKFQPEEPIATPIIKEVYGPTAEFVWIGYRNEGVHSKNILYLKIISELLNNGTAGLIDLNLVQKQKILKAGCSFDENIDYSTIILNASPRKEQSLDEAKELLLQQIELLKKGEFDDWLIEAVINNIRLNETREIESNWGRAFKMTSSFILGQKWAEIVNQLNELRKITKPEIVKFANEHFGNNYVVVKKLKGKDAFAYKVDKPKITPLNIERNEQSEFYKKFESMQEKRVIPVFVDYKSAIKNDALGQVPFSYIKNSTNDIFTLYYIVDMGTDNDKKIGLAIKYLTYLGTNKYSAADLQKEFFKLGLSFDVFSSRDRVYVYLTGLEDSFEKGIALFEHFLENVVADENALQELIKGIEKERADAKLNKGVILNGAMRDYAVYGNSSPFKNILAKDEIAAVKSDELISRIKSLTKYKHRIFYYGQKEIPGVIPILKNNHKSVSNLKDYPPAVQFKELETNANKAYFVDYDMVQAEMLFISKAQIFNAELMPRLSLFNQYFGSGLSSIVFQEIREAKALAYTARASFTTPSKKEDSHFVTAYVGTQADKMKDAMDAMLQLMNNMPEAGRQFDAAKLSALKEIETERITKTDIFWNYEQMKKLGIDYDIRKTIYEGINKLNMTDMKNFFNENIKGKKYNYLVIGKRENVNINLLQSLGEYKELPLEEIFGY